MPTDELVERVNAARATRCAHGVHTPQKSERNAGGARFQYGEQQRRLDDDVVWRATDELVECVNAVRSALRAAQQGRSEHHRQVAQRHAIRRFVRRHPTPEHTSY